MRRGGGRSCEGCRRVRGGGGRGRGGGERVWELGDGGVERRGGG